MLDIELGRRGPAPKDAATILCLRDGPNGLEVLCVERHARSRFLGGAIVFPGGKVDEADASAEVLAGATPPRATRVPVAESDAALSALAVAACRECFEEAGILYYVGERLAEDALRDMRARLAKGEKLGALLREHGVSLDLARLSPFARWITPESEARRFDTRFYLAAAPALQSAVHDAHETTDAFWGRPRDVLARFARGDCALFPPTHRSLEILADVATVEDAPALTTSLEPICPELTEHVDAQGKTLALTLPGDPAHPVRETRVPGLSRYVLRGEQWLPEPAPAT